MPGFSVVDLLQSSGPIALNELVMRLSEQPKEVVRAIKRLQREGSVSISGPLAAKIRLFNSDAEPSPNTGSVDSLTDNEILGASDTFIELSMSSLRRSLAS
jgi:hypothetical protein